MLGAVFILLLGLSGITTGHPKSFPPNSVQVVPATKQLQLDHANTPVNRDYQATSHQVPATNQVNSGYSSGGTDVGQYYYYMPVQEEEYGGGAAAAGAQQHELMTPLLIIIVLLVAILLQLALPGLLAALAAFIGPLLPTFEFEAITVPVPDANGRSFFGSNFISWDNLNWLTLQVRSAIEADECGSRLVCQTARYADGSNSFLTLLEYMPTEEYSSYVKIFKDSALRKNDCNTYKCGSLGTNSLIK